MIRVALLICALAGSAAAQELVFSPAATEGCLAGGGGEACIGASAQACMRATDGGETTYGMSGCLSYELDYWDNRLNAAYGVLRRKAREADAEMQMIGGSAEPLEPALRDMQRAWIPWRDATCDFERAQWGGGTGGGPATYACLMRLTGRQALYLQTVWLGD